MKTLRPTLFSKKVLIDADLLLELFVNRSESVEDVEKILEIAQSGLIELYATEFCIHKIKLYLGNSDEDLGQDTSNYLRKVLQGHILAVNDKIISVARRLPLNDFESSIELACAVTSKLDAIVTDNAHNFGGVDLPIWAPDFIFLSEKSYEPHGLTRSPFSPEEMASQLEQMQTTQAQLLQSIKRMHQQQNKQDKKSLHPSNWLKQFVNKKLPSHSTHPCNKTHYDYSFVINVGVRVLKWLFLFMVGFLIACIVSASLQAQPVVDKLLNLIPAMLPPLIGLTLCIMVGAAILESLK
jgi:PIN domain